MAINGSSIAIVPSQEAGERIIDRVIRFVAQDSQGQCFLWAIRWGQAGYSCRSARLTEAESDELYVLSSGKSEESASNAVRDAFQGSDPNPRTGSFVEEANAIRFFAPDRDSDLTRWAGILFKTIRAFGDSTDLNASIRMTPYRERSVNCVPVFRLRLRNGGSIGPSELKRIWSIAAASDDVVVSREGSWLGNPRSPFVYVMSGPAHLADLSAVEKRLRDLLQETLTTAHIDLTRLV